MKKYENSFEIEDDIDLILRDMASIKTQLEDAKSYAAETGKYSDAEWFRSATHALRMKAIDHQALQRELGRMNKEERRKESRSLGELFMTSAREKLDEKLFQELMSEAIAKSSAK